MKNPSRKILLLLIAILWMFVGNAQIITTVAGNGTFTSSGDSGPAISAGLSVPYGGELDTSGNYYFVEAAKNKVRMLSVNGNIYTIAGNGVAGFSGDGGSSTLAQVSSPQWVTTDTKGNIYISDAGNKRIRKINNAGIISTVAGNGLSGYNGDGIAATSASIDPAGICVDTAGNLYISESGRIRKVNSLNLISTIAGTGATGFSGDGDLATVAKIHAHGIYIHAGDLYVSDFNRIRVINKTTNVIQTIAGTGLGNYNGDDISAAIANFATVALAWDQHENIYIADMGNNRVRMIDNLGLIHTVAGNGIPGYFGDGGVAQEAQLYGPSGIAFDTCGNLFITCKQNYRIRKVTFNPTCNPTKAITTTSQAFNISLHPNPTLSILTLTSTEKITTLTLTNTLGQLVHHQQYPGKEQIELNLAHLPPGIYTLKINNTHIRRITKL